LGSGSGLVPAEPGFTLAGTGGAVFAIASVRFGRAERDAGALQGTRLARADVAAQIEDYAKKTLEERRRIPGLPSERADIVLAGACVVKGILETLRVETFVVSVRGLRHALARELFARAP
jgi:exopolyphosphatase/guanosine-5'-triphosphate,3'-diphosphate pyrophosphatase